MSLRSGITRTAAALDHAAQGLTEIAGLYEGCAAKTIADLDLRARLTCGLMIVKAAQRRQESRGAHYRSDYPGKNEALRQHFSDQLAIPSDAQTSTGSTAASEMLAPAFA